MKEFITENIVSIIVAAVFVLALFVMIFGFRGKFRDKAKQLLLSLVVAAENKFTERGSGKLKFSFVSEKLYAIMPPAFQFFFTADTIGIWIEEAVTKMKEYLAKHEDIEEIESVKEIIDSEVDTK